MAESFINQTEGSGKKAHTFQRVIGGNTVEDQVTLLGEHYLATYNVVTAAAGTSAATAASHILQIMAGASLNVFVRWIKVYQLAPATAAAIDALELVRLTTAGTGGTVVTPAALDTADSASGATAMTLPTVKGTEGTFIERATVQWTQTVATQSGGQMSQLLATFDFDGFHEKGLRIPSGAANGIALKNPTARAAATVIVVAKIVETNFA